MLHTNGSTLTDTEQVDEIMFQAMSAQDAYLQLNQRSIDRIVTNMARVGESKHLTLAKLAVGETDRGIVEDKSITNIFACSGLEQKLQNIQTVGLVEDNEINGYQIIAEPVGILAAFPPSEHPTATTLLQAMVSVKTRNPIVFCFHPSVHSSSKAAAQLMQQAAQAAGVPPYAIQWLPTGSTTSINALTQHPEISLILMDENNSPRFSPQSLSDVPILGTGPINTPCFIDRSADIEQAATDVIASRHFDNGLIPSSEQTVIISREVYFQTLDLLMQKSCHLASEQEKVQLEQLLFDQETGVTNSECIGQDAVHIARMAGFSVPEQTKLLITEIGGIGTAHPLSRSKAVPVLSLLAAESWYEGLCFCEAVLEFGSAPHTAVLHARDPDLCDDFSARLNASHIILNQPATRGDLCKVTVSTSNSITSAGDRQAATPATAQLSLNMLLHRKLIQKPNIRIREWKTPEKVLFAQGCSKHLQTLPKMERTLIVTEKELLDSDHLDAVFHHLNDQEHPIKTEFFCKTKRVVTVSSIEEGVECMNAFRPTAVLVIGNGAAIDTAKAMRYFYQRPESPLPRCSPNLHSADFPDCATAPPQRRTSLIAMPTTPGAGFNINSFITIFDDSREKRRNLHSCELLPDITLIDPAFSTPLDRRDIALTGMTILSHALEAYVSPLASDYSDSMTMKAIQLIFEYLPTAFARKQMSTREKLYNAAAMAGMAAGNAKSGLTHAMVHSLGSALGVSHNMAHSLLLPHVIRYNGVEDPSRFNPLMPGSRYIAHERYQKIAKNLGLACKSPEQGVESLVKAITRMQQELDLPCTIRACGISKQGYLAKMEQMAEHAFEDHSTATNPRLPLIREIIAIYNDLY
jgi:acetaldehyde dehydrogenase / alcohol dehydrogenase